MGKKSSDQERKKKRQASAQPRGLPAMGSANPRATLKAAAASLSLREPLPSVPEGQKSLQRSSYHSGESLERLRTQLPGVWDAASGGGEVLASGEGIYLGDVPAEGLTSRDVWKAIQPQVESRENRRSAELYAQVINQFAVGSNPRYVCQGTDETRAHIFIWDVTRAMGAEIPHMLGARELSCAQMVNWLRYDGSDRGWVRIMSVERALVLAQEGRPVVALPRDLKAKAPLLAVVRPEPAGADGLPHVAAAGLIYGNDVSCSEALGVSSVDFFSHP